MDNLIEDTYGPDTVVAQESLEMRKEGAKLVEELNTPMFGPMIVMGPKSVFPLIRTQDGHNFRMYIRAPMLLDTGCMSKIYRFLDGRTEGQSVTIILGSTIADEFAHRVGALISAIQSCHAKVTTVAAGYCGITETMIWAFGHEREIYRYGALTFGVTEIIRYVEKFKYTFELFLQQGKEIGFLTDEDIKDIWETKNTKFFLYGDIIKNHTDLGEATES